MGIKKSHAFTLALGTGLTLLMAAMYLFPPHFVIFLENKTYDSMLRSLHHTRTSGHVVIVDIDDASLAKYGQWPWPRYKVASLLERIKQGGAISVALDMIFAEPDRTSLSSMRERFKRDLGFDLRIEGAPDEFKNSDHHLARTLSSGPFVLAFYFSHQDGLPSPADCLLHPLNTLIKESPDAATPARSLYTPRGVVCSLKPLVEAVSRSGYIDALPDPDGIYRRIPLMMEFQGQTYPSLALAALLEAMGSHQVLMELTADGIDSLRVGDTRIPLGPLGTMLIHYRGGNRTFKHVSAADILDGGASPEVLKDKIVFVGTSASGLHDIKATPLNPAFSGVEINATIVDNILERDFLSSPTWVGGLEVLMILLLGLLSTVLLTWARTTWGLLSVLAAGTALWGASCWLMENESLVLSPLIPLMTLGVNLTCLVSCRSLFEELRGRKRAADLIRTQSLTIIKIAALAEYRDPETGGHILRTQHYVKRLAQQLSANPRFKSRLSDEVIEDMFKLIFDSSKKLMQ